MTKHINTIAGRYAAFAETRYDSTKKIEGMSLNLLLMLMGDGATAGTSSIIDSAVAMIGGYLHSVGEEDSPVLAGTANFVKLVDHMPSNYRPANNKAFAPVFKAVFDEVEIIIDGVRHKRFVIKNDLSHIHEEYKREVSEGSLFGYIE